MRERRRRLRAGRGAAATTSRTSGRPCAVPPARNTAAVAERTAKGTRRGEATGPERNLVIAERSGRKASARSHAERTVAAEFRAYREEHRE